MAHQWLTLTNPGGLDQRSRVPNQLVLEAENLGLAHDGWLVLRPGVGSESLTGASLTGPIQWLGRFITTTGTEELWLAAENSGAVAVLRRRVTGTWNSVTFSDTVTVADLRYLHGATLNGKYFLAYNSDVNRLHVWDGSTLRRVGLQPASNPTVAAMGAGGLSWTRYYRTRNATQSSGTTVRRSEPSAVVSITIAAKAGATVTKGAVSGDGETHWEVEYADATAGPWYRASTIAVGTTTYDDTAATVSTTNLSQTAGLNVPPPSAKFLISDGSRLLMAGSWETSGATGETEPHANRVWFTRALRTTDIGDDETIPDTATQENWIDVGDGGRVVGLAGPLYGDVWVFKDDSIWKLTPTSDSTAPYARACVTKKNRGVSQRTIWEADSNGAPAIFFAAPNKLQRISGGIDELSQPIARDLRASNFSLENSAIAVDPASNQLVAVVNTSASTVTGGYYTFTYDTTSGRWCGVNLGGSLQGWILGVSTLGVDTTLGDSGAFMRAMTVATASDGQERLLLGGQDTNSAAALVSWGTALGADADAAFTGRVRWRSIVAQGHKVSVGAPTVIYRNPSGSVSTTATLTLTYLREDGESVSQSKTLTALTSNDSLSMRSLTFEGLAFADVQVLDVRATLSYSAGFTGSVWPGVDAIQVPYGVQEEVAV